MTTQAHTSTPPTPPPDPRPLRGWRHLSRAHIVDAACTVATGCAAWALLVFLIPKRDLYPLHGAAHLALTAAVSATLAGLTLGVFNAITDLTGMWEPCTPTVQIAQARRALDWYGFLPAASDATVLDGIQAAAVERRRLQALLDWNDIPRDATAMPDALLAADQRAADQAAAEISNRDAVIDRLTADAATVADQAIAAFLGARAQGATDHEAKTAAVIAAYGNARTTSELLGVPLSADSTGQAGG